MYRLKLVFISVLVTLVLYPVVESFTTQHGLTRIQSKPIEREGTVRVISAYTSSPEETDDSPCESANGTNICALYAEGTNVCASNAYPLGSVIEVDGLGICVVADRMNARFTNAVDWYFGFDREAALNFGRQLRHVYDHF